MGFPAAAFRAGLARAQWRVHHGLARRRLEAIVADRKSAQKQVWRVRILLLTDDGHGISAIMRAACVSKTGVWRWRERVMAEGIDGLLRDRTRPPGKQPVAADTVAEVLRLTQPPPPHEATLWTARAMAKARPWRA